MSVRNKHPNKSTFGIISIAGKNGGQGYEKFGHVALMTRESGKVTCVMGFRPREDGGAEHMRSKSDPVDGSWRDDKAMLDCANAESWEWEVTQKIAEEFRSFLTSESANTKWKYHFHVPQVKAEDKAERARNCVHAMLKTIHANFEMLAQKSQRMRGSLTDIEVVRDAFKHDYLSSKVKLRKDTGGGIYGWNHAEFHQTISQLYEKGELYNCL